MTRAIDLSKYIVVKCDNDRHPISNLQLQKFLYYIQKEFLKKGYGNAFADDIEAWQFGPVVPNVYYYFCGFGAMPITLFNQTYNSDCLTYTPEALTLINEIVEKKRELDPWDLVNETHKPNGAWAQTYNNGEGNHKVIPVELIKAVG